MERACADGLLDKLRDIVANTLNDDERALFAALIAPGIALAYGEAEVEGFALEWSSAALPAALVDAVRNRQVRIEGL
jgi:hypothetical protein